MRQDQQCQRASVFGFPLASCSVRAGLVFLTLSFGRSSSTSRHFCANAEGKGSPNCENFTTCHEEVELLSLHMAWLGELSAALEVRDLTEQCIREIIERCI